MKKRINQAWTIARCLERICPKHNRRRLCELALIAGTLRRMK